MYVNKSKRAPPLHFSALSYILRTKKFPEISSFFPKSVLNFLSFRYTAGFQIFKYFGENWGKIGKNIFRNFFEFFSEVSGSRIVPKNVKGGTLWDFLKIHSVAKYQKIDGGSFGAIKKSEKNEKFEQSHSAEKRGKVS